MVPMDLSSSSVDEILADFRANGSDVAYADYLNDIELDRYCPEGKSLIRGLFLDASDLNSEMKIIRPPSKTPSHLPTSTFNLVRKHHERLAQVPISASPSGYSVCNTKVYQGMSPVVVPAAGWRVNIAPYSASYVVDLTTSMSQMTISDQGSNYFAPTPALPSSRPIYGNGSSKKPLNSGNCPQQFWSSPCVPFLTGIQLVSPPRETAKIGVLPPISQNTKKRRSACLEVECSSEDELLSVSADSGNSTGGDLSSAGSDVSPKSSCGESPSPSYASILNASSSDRSSGDCSWKDKAPETPKSRQPEGFKANLKLQKKLRCAEGRSSDRSSSSSSDLRRSVSPKECVFCKTNGEMPYMYRGHVLKDDQGQTVCHVLQKYICPICGATGSKAHTVKYCPANRNPPAVSMMTTLKSMRSATGDVRVTSNSRRSRALAKRNPRRTATGASSYGGSGAAP